MNRRQKLVQEQFLHNEERVIKRLREVYGQSLKDINAKIKDLEFSIDGLTEQYDWMEEDDPERATVKSKIQSKIYQKQYQEQLQKQVDGILTQMNTKQYLTVADYLDECYSDGFVGTVFDMHGQGVPLMMPLDQEAMVRAVQTDSKIRNGLYTHLGENVTQLKRHITAQISRGISTGMSYSQVAKQLSLKMMGTYKNPGGSMAYATRIARTEGHRIQCTAAMDACHMAKDRGADVVKQWDAALDARTRESHTMVDGEIRELDEAFSNGLQYPGDPAGGAAEVVNCRCALLQRARWALDESELKTLQERAEYYGLDKTEQFDDFKKKYLKAAEPVAPAKTTAFTPAKTLEEAEEYAQQFVSTYKSKYSGTVSFKGMDIETANKVNKVLTEVYDKYDVPVLRNVTGMNFREKIWKDAVEHGVAAAYRWGGNGGDLFVNQKLIGTTKLAKAFDKKGKDLLETVLGGADKLLKDGNLRPVQRKYIEALAKSGRQCVSQSLDDFVEATIVHEMGHSLDDKVFRKAFKSMSNPEGFDIVASMEKYGAGVSGYAVSKADEYVAESFTAWWYGMTDVVDPGLAKIFKGAMKK